MILWDLNISLKKIQKHRNILIKYLFITKKTFSIIRFPIKILRKFRIKFITLRNLLKEIDCLIVLMFIQMFYLLFLM